VSELRLILIKECVGQHFDYSNILFNFCRPEAIYAAVKKKSSAQPYPAGEGKSA